MRATAPTHPLPAPVTSRPGRTGWKFGHTCAYAAALIACVCTAAAQQHAAEFVPSYVAGSRDAAGRLMGGTEIRALAAHGGKLFAGNGYWEDRPGSEGTPGAQVLVLDAPGARWRVDGAFEDLLPGGRRRHLAVSALTEATFRTDGRGAALSVPRSFLLASTWDVTGTRTVFVRDDATGTWSGTVLAQDRPAPRFLPQIRSFGTHKDSSTGVDFVFAGDTRGILSGFYDPGAAGGLHWNSAPELPITAAMSDGFPGLAGRVRIGAFAEADGRVFAVVGQQVWVRRDGPSPSWELLYTNPAPAFSETGLRGLTTVTEQGSEALLAVVEGRKSRVVRINPRTGAETTDLDLAGFLDEAWRTRVSYVVGAYNDMARLPVPGGGEALLIGLETFIPPAAPRPPGHKVLDVNHGLEAGAWFLIRRSGGRYELHEVPQVSAPTGADLVAVRVARASPFPGQAATIYLGGYDANDSPAHDTAWIVQGHASVGSR
jgi:hypothetical protein